MYSFNKFKSDLTRDVAEFKYQECSKGGIDYNGQTLIQKLEDVVRFQRNGLYRANAEIIEQIVTKNKQINALEDLEFDRQFLREKASQAIMESKILFTEGKELLTRAKTGEGNQGVLLTGGEIVELEKFLHTWDCEPNLKQTCGKNHKHARKIYKQRARKGLSYYGNGSVMVIGSE
jgi:hypothetical protein